MAITARQRGVTARQGKADGIVHEPGRIQVDRVEVTTEVLLVALGAASASQGGVKTLAVGDPGPKRRMALEAQIVRDTAFPEPVARRAVPQPVEIGVGGGQLAG
ncbi:MAG: hypothetical protein AMS20_02665 [Gemmatimonas sp. SG8_28]|nr:MAG: hypothetical protein AMS20_02665 [Gemmatimonas sp. SG8_28]